MLILLVCNVDFINMLFFLLQNCLLFEATTAEWSLQNAWLQLQICLLCDVIIIVDIIAG